MIRYPETWVFDVFKCEWSVCTRSQNASITNNKGFSLVTMHHKDKMFLIAFGGNRKEPSNQIELLVMIKNEHASSWRSVPDADPLACDDCPRTAKQLSSVDSIARNGLSSAIEHHISARKSLSDSSSDLNPLSGSTSLRKQFHNEEECNLVLKTQKSIEDGRLKESDDFLKPKNSLAQVMDQRGNKQETTVHMDIAGVLSSAEENIIIPLETEGRLGIQTDTSDIYQLYETKIATLTRKNSLLEGELTAALANQEAAEKNLSSVVKSKQDMERKLTDTAKEVELLKEKLTGLELAQEEANSLSNIVHSDNVRLEHDVAFLKAVLDDTQKELHSTRGVLAGERSRAFQLQVEVFHLKQRLQSLENRVPTPRKPYHM